MPDKFIVVAKIGAPYGVKGWVNFYSLSDSPDKLMNYERWYIQHGTEWQELAIDEIKPHGKHLIAHIENINDRDIAKRLTNKKVAIPDSQLPKLTNGYYWSDLEGLKVLTEKGDILGTVEELMNTGANDILVVSGKKRYLIPFVEGKTVLTVDLEKREIVVDWDTEF